MRTRIARGAGIVLLSVLALAGCSAVEDEFGGGEETGSEAPEQSGEGNFTDRKTNDVWVDESQIQLSDGRVVTEGGGAAQAPGFSRG